MAGVGVVLERREGVVSRARVALLGLGLTPSLCEEASEALVGGTLSDADIAAAVDAVVGAAQPLDDQHASARYKRDVAAVLARRAIGKARDRSG